MEGIINRYRPKTKIIDCLESNKMNMILERKYGAFLLKNKMAYWNHDNRVKLQMQLVPENAGMMEGIWNPSSHLLKERYQTAITGMCIWSKYDCYFSFKSQNKGNPGAIRSLSSPKDKKDLLMRLQKGRPLAGITVSEDIFGPYQRKLIAWQKSVVSRYKINCIYYSLPIQEYLMVLQELQPYLSASQNEFLFESLHQCYHQLRCKIEQYIEVDVEFVNPMLDNQVTCIKSSYTWPYRNLPVEIAFEEMEEVQIPYQLFKSGNKIPPILLGMIGFPCPYYVKLTEGQRTMRC